MSTSWSTGMTPETTARIEDIVKRFHMAHDGTQRIHELVNFQLDVSGAEAGAAFQEALSVLDARLDEQLRAFPDARTACAAVFPVEIGNLWPIPQKTRRQRASEEAGQDKQPKLAADQPSLGRIEEPAYDEHASHIGLKREDLLNRSGQSSKE